MSAEAIEQIDHLHLLLAESEVGKAQAQLEAAQLHQRLAMNAVGLKYGLSEGDTYDRTTLKIARKAPAAVPPAAKPADADGPK